MGRMVTAVVTHGGATAAGAVGPFHVGNPWWAEVETVVSAALACSLAQGETR